MCPILNVVLENARVLLGGRVKRRVRLAPLALMLVGLLAGAVDVRADQVNPPGTMDVDADSAADPLLFGDLIALPWILESSAGEWTDGSTITVDAPDHFAFATDVDSVTAQVLAGDVLLVGQVGDTATATPTATQIQFTVDTPGQSTVASTIEFADIRLRAIDATGATAGTAEITVTTAGTLLDEPLVLVTVLPGAVDPASCSIALDVGSDGTATADDVDFETILVELRDQWGNLIGGESVILEPNDGSPLPGDVTGAGPIATDAVTGIATFDIARTVAEPLQLRGSAAGELIDLPTPVDLTFDPGPATQLDVFPDIADPLTAGAFNVTVITLDAFDNPGAPVAALTGIQLFVQQGGDNLSGTTIGGILPGGSDVTINGAIYELAEPGVQLRAVTIGGDLLASGLSNVFEVVAAAPSALAFHTQPPTLIESGAIFATQVQVLDMFGNPVPAPLAGEVTVGIFDDPTGGFANLAGTLAQLADAGGIATFNDLTIDLVGAGYTLQATSDAGAAPAISNQFSIYPEGETLLDFRVQPSSATTDEFIYPPVQIEVQDINGNRVTGYNSPITLLLEDNPGGATLAGGGPVNAVAGVAVFGNLRLNRPHANPYTLRATGIGILPAGEVVSGTFNISAGVADQLEFVAQPNDAPAGDNIGPVTVQLRDASGNPVADNGVAVTVNIDADSDPSAGAAVLGGVLTQATANGVATFGPLSVDVANNGYELSATSPGLISATSAAFNVSTAGPARLEFVQQPTSIVADANFAPSISVRVLDSSDNPVDVVIPITLEILNDPSGTGVLIGDFAEDTVAGVATFANPLTIQRSGNGYTLRATTTAPGVASADSSSFSVSAAAADHLLFERQPNSTGIGLVINGSEDGVIVAILDQFNNVVPAGGVDVLLTLNGPGSLGGTNPRATVAGRASFNDLTVDTTFSGYTMTASAAVAPPIISNAFDILGVTNLVAMAPVVVPSGDDTDVTVSYEIQGPVVVPNFNIHIFRMPAGILLEQFPAPGLAPGFHSQVRTLTALNGNIADGESIEVRLDPNDFVIEVPGDNVSSTPVDVDLQGQSVSVIGDAVETTFTYDVNADAAVPGYQIQLWLDRAAVAGELNDLLATHVGEDTPGTAYQVVSNLRSTLDALRVNHGDRIVAVLDSGTTVTESDEFINNQSASQSFAVNLRVDALTLLSEPFGARLTYTVESPARVPDFNIRFALQGVGTLRTVAGNPMPGPHTVEAADINLDAALRTLGIEAGENATIVATLDSGGTVVESDEVNQLSAAAAYRVDLQMTFLNFTGTDLDTDFSITTQYRAAINQPVENFSVGIYASGNDSPSIGADDVLVRRVQITTAAGKTTGVNHTLDLTGLQVSSGDFPDGEFVLKVRVDDGGTVAETDEGNNVLTARNVAENLQNIDNDGDGLTLREELDGFRLDGVFRADELEPGRQIAADRTRTTDDAIDTDGDGLNDRLERNHGTNPNDPDTDADGLEDGVEDADHDGSVDAGETNPRHWDSDGDGLSDSEELAGFTITRYARGSTTGRFREATVVTVTSDPLLADSDGDGISDWDEVNTWARFADADTMDAIGLENVLARYDAPVDKPVRGIRTDPTLADTDADGLNDDVDPAPQVNPARWGYDTNGDHVFNLTDLAAIRADAEAAGQDTTDFPTDVTTFQRRLLDFDQDGDGFLEAPDANGDGFPDFTRYNEATLEQAFGLDFSNDGTLNDGFDVGGLDQGPAETPDTREGSVAAGIRRFGTFRVIRADNGQIIGDGVIDQIDSIGQLIPTDNCPNESNAEQRDYDGDGLGDSCDADLDNDGVPEPLDPVAQEPSGQVFAPLCGFGMVETMLLSMVGLAGWRRFGTKGRRRA